MDKKLAEAYGKEAEKLKQALDEITAPLVWRSVEADEDSQSKGLSPDVGPSPTPEEEAESPQ